MKTSKDHKTNGVFLSVGLLTAVVLCVQWKSCSAEVTHIKSKPHPMHETHEEGRGLLSGLLNLLGATPTKKATTAAPESEGEHPTTEKDSSKEIGKQGNSEEADAKRKRQAEPAPAKQLALKNLLGQLVGGNSNNTKQHNANATATSQQSPPNGLLALLFLLQAAQAQAKELKNTTVAVANNPTAYASAAAAPVAAKIAAPAPPSAAAAPTVKKGHKNGLLGLG